MNTIQDTSEKVRQKQGFDDRLNYSFVYCLNKQIENNSHHIKVRYLKEEQSTSNLHLIGIVKFCHLQVTQIRQKYRQEIMKQDSIFQINTLHDICSCYDVTSPNPEDTNGAPAIWERGTRDARTILHFLSKGVSVLEVVRNGLPGSMTTTYQISPPLDQRVKTDSLPLLSGISMPEQLTYLS